MTNYDVIIIGAGVVGGAAARELSRYELSVLCLEKEFDVCCGISKGNTGIIHSPALVPQGTKKAHYSTNGRQHFEKLSRELGFTLQNPGALVLAYTEEDVAVLKSYIKTAEANYLEAGIEPPEYSIVQGAELAALEPALSPDVNAALLAPDTGRIIPYEYGIALFENAVANGLELKLRETVKSVSREGGNWLVETGGGVFSAPFVINAAGHGSGELGAAAGFAEAEIRRVKGQYLILGRGSRPEVNHILFQVPPKAEKHKGKGILVTRTVYGNIMIGPDAVGQEEAEDTSTDLESSLEVIRGALRSIPSIDAGKAIKSFAGVRPRPAGGDFIIESKDGFVHLCGIESPGLTSSPAIAEEALKLLEAEGLELSAKSDFNPFRKPIVGEVLTLEAAELKRRIALPAGDAGRLVCRCEQVPEARIADAVNRGIPVTTIDGVKRRTRAGQGFCQGGFCGGRVRSFLAEKLNVSGEEITQRGTEGEPQRVDLKKLREKL